MKALFEVIKQIHGENGNWSSKRVYGGLLLISAVVCVFTGNNHPLLEAILYTGAAMIVSGTAVKIAQTLKKQS